MPDKRGYALLRYKNGWIPIEDLEWHSLSNSISLAGYASVLSLVTQGADTSSRDSDPRPANEQKYSPI